MDIVLIAAQWIAVAVVFGLIIYMLPQFLTIVLIFTFCFGVGFLIASGFETITGKSNPETGHKALAGIMFLAFTFVGARFLEWFELHFGDGD